MSTSDVKNSSRARRGRGLTYLILVFLVFIAGSALWSWVTLSWSYSDGTRAGVLQKFSHRGWLCKTTEGDLAQYVIAGVSPQIWTFSVRDPAVAAQLTKVVGSRVQLHYTEHRGILSNCFADTRYFVDGVTVIEENPIPLPTRPAATPASAPAPAATPPASATSPPSAPPQP